MNLQINLDFQNLSDLDIRKFYGGIIDNAGSKIKNCVVFIDASDVDFTDPYWGKDISEFWIATFHYYGELDVSEDYEKYSNNDSFLHFLEEIAILEENKHWWSLDK
jgi:hypothetical protein